LAAAVVAAVAEPEMLLNHPLLHLVAVVALGFLWGRAVEQPAVELINSGETVRLQLAV
jgi:hypothetical protein